MNSSQNGSPELDVVMAPEAAKQSVRILAAELFTGTKYLKTPKEVDTNQESRHITPNDSIDPLRVIMGIKKIIDMRAVPGAEMSAGMPSHIGQFTEIIVDIFGPQKAFEVLNDNLLTMQEARES